MILSLQNSQLLDIDADRSNIRRLLGDIEISIDELQTQAFKYKTNQKNFKVSVSIGPLEGACSLFICMFSPCLAGHHKLYIFLAFVCFFQVEVTKYEALEELTAEVKLKQLLWDSLEEWENLENSWLQVIFYILLKHLKFSLSLKIHLMEKYHNSLDLNCKLKCSIIYNNCTSIIFV